MANWRILTCDKAILKAIQNGFDDADFNGWAEMPADVRVACVKSILEHHGMEHIVFRHSFARSLWGDALVDGYIDEFAKQSGREMKGFKSWEQKLTSMVLADDWCRYLRDHL